MYPPRKSGPWSYIEEQKIISFTLKITFLVTKNILNPLRNFHIPSGEAGNKETFPLFYDISRHMQMYSFFVLIKRF